jgi:hypothetical protein
MGELTKPTILKRRIKIANKIHEEIFSIISGQKENANQNDTEFSPQTNWNGYP